jgi:hypothetical protein
MMNEYIFKDEAVCPQDRAVRWLPFSKVMAASVLVDCLARDWLGPVA